MRVVLHTFLLLTWTLVPAIAAAQTPPATPTPPPPPAAEPPPPPPRLERKAELSLVATGGNTDTQTLGVGASLAWRPAPWTTEAKVAFVRAETNDVETARSLTAELREARSINERLDAFGRVSYLSNEFSGINARTGVDGGIAYHLLRGPVHTFRVDAGLGYLHEERTTGEDLSFPLLNLGSGYRWRIAPTADLTEAILFTASLEDAANRRFSNAFALTAALTRLLSLKLSHEYRFVNTPPAGFRKNDTLLTMALVAAF